MAIEAENKNNESTAGYYKIYEVLIKNVYGTYKLIDNIWKDKCIADRDYMCGEKYFCTNGKKILTDLIAEKIPPLYSDAMNGRMKRSSSFYIDKFCKSINNSLDVSIDGLKILTAGSDSDNDSIKKNCVLSIVKELLRSNIGKDSINADECKKAVEEIYNVAINQLKNCSKENQVNCDHDPNKSSENISKIQKLYISPNIYMGTKNEIEQKLSIEEKCYKCKKIEILNLASTAFLTGDEVDEKNSENDLKRWFHRNLEEGKITMDITLTKPFSSANEDAYKYKMYPSEIREDIIKNYTFSEDCVDISEIKDRIQYIIPYNFNHISNYININRLSKVKLFYTDIALPVGILKVTHEKEHSDQNFMQVNIYLPCISDDENRPTFILYEKNEETKQIYKIFNDMLTNINKTQFSGHPKIGFLFKRPICHRALLHKKNSDIEMNRDCVIECLEKGYPIEVDLLSIGTKSKSHEIIVGRDRDVVIDGEYIELSKLDQTQLDVFRKQETKRGDFFSQLLTLDELLQLLEKYSTKNGSASALLEIKDEWNTSYEAILDHIINICSIIHKYPTVNVALCSANPITIICAKNYDVFIPFGWITLDFNKHADKYNSVDPIYKDIHAHAIAVGGKMPICQYSKFAERFYVPDFVCCHLGDFEESELIEKCAYYDIKMLGWVARTQKELNKAMEQKYSNVLFETFEA